MTILTKLVAAQTDSQGYTTYVFHLLDYDDQVRLDSKYIMCTRWPNWDHRELKLFEKGYVELKEIIAGIDKWWNGSEFIPYNYTNIQFVRFLNYVDEDEKYEFKL